jgi:hypothetical protein
MEIRIPDLMAKADGADHESEPQASTESKWQAVLWR